VIQDLIGDLSVLVGLEEGGSRLTAGMTLSSLLLLLFPPLGELL
jgi:hypothetical protein